MPVTMCAAAGGSATDSNEWVSSVTRRSDREPRAVLRLKDASCVVKSKREEKELLKGISVSVNSGNVLAIMGPSGAGKTMLMNLLALERGPGRRFGSVSLNKAQLTTKLFSQLCALVPQMDQHWAFLRCRETLEMAADLYLRVSTQAKRARVDDLLIKMGLEKCQDLRVGNQFVPGLSGGQRRRLSIAIALIKDPLVIFLDEPTSGLDAAAASGVMSFLTQMARNTDTIVVCTIHQPSFRVFQDFDQLLLLSGGEMAYCGPAQEASLYFASIKHPFPENENPADYLLDIANPEFTEASAVEEVLRAWQTLGSGVPQPKLSGATELDPPPRPPQHSCFTHIRVLLKRHAILILRDPTMYTGRMVMNMISCCFFAVVYIKARERSQSQALNRLWMMIWFVGVPANLGVVAVFGLNAEFVTVRKETKNGMYGFGSYLVAQTLLQVPLMFVLTFFAVTIPGYGIANMHGAQYIQFACVFAANLWCFECMAQFCAVSAENPLLGMLAFMNFWFAAFLFNGIMVPETDVVWPLRALCLLLPMKYSLASLVYVEFHDTQWEGVVADSSSPRGFSCPEDTTGLACYGQSGVQVLQSFSINFRAISAEDNVWRDVSAIVAIALCFKFFYVVIAGLKCRGIAPPSPPTARRSNQSR